MKTVGNVLHQARTATHQTREDLSNKTKIKTSFIKALEEEKWSLLPAYGVVSGFVRNIAQALDLDPVKIVALLRRDYPPKLLGIPTPKPDLEDRAKFSWSPKYTAAFLAIVAILLIGGYLGFQYKNAYALPRLTIYEPHEGELIVKKAVTVVGKADPDTAIVINNQPVILDEKGNFKSDILLLEGDQEIKITATSRLGKTSTLTRKVKVDLDS